MLPWNYVGRRQPCPWGWQFARGEGSAVYASVGAGPILSVVGVEVSILLGVAVEAASDAADLGGLCDMFLMC